MRFVYGNTPAEAANQNIVLDAARDSRYFQSLAANRSAQAQRMAQAQAEANNRLSWEQLLAQAALTSRGRNDDLAQRQFSNRLRQDEFDRGVTSSAQHQSNVLEDLALRKRGMDLQYGPEQRSERALGRFEKLAPFLADDPSLTKESIRTMRPDFTPEDLSVAEAIFESNRLKKIQDEEERARATAMANRQLLSEERDTYWDEVKPKLDAKEVEAMGRGSKFNWGRNRKATPEDVTNYQSEILADIRSGHSDASGLQPFPPSDAVDIFREVSRNNKMAPSSYNEGTGRFEFKPRFTTPTPAATASRPTQLQKDITAVQEAYKAGDIDRARAVELLRELGGR